MYANIEAERARYHLTQEDLARKLGVSQKTLQNWLNGKTDIPSSYLVKMSTMWHVTTDYLLGLNRSTVRDG